MFVLAALLITFGGTFDAAAAKKKKSRSIKPVAARFNPANYLTIDKIADLYGLSRPVSTGSGFRLAGPAGTIDGRPGSRLLRVNGTAINLTSPVTAHQGQVYLSKSDTAHVVDPLLRPRSVKGPKRVHTVVVDAGHGGHDTGARGRYGREKDFTLDTAKRLEKHLRSAGFRVVMTRTTDTFVPLPARAAIAAREKDAVFVSVHYNKGRPSASGVETFALTPPGVPPYESSRRYPGSNPGNATDGANILLAAKIHGRIAAAAQSNDRGVKFERFHVLRNNGVPAALVEGGFVSNARDGRAIAEQRYRETLARAIAQGIKDYAHAISRGTHLRQVSNEKRRGLFSGLFSRAKKSEETF